MGRSGVTPSEGTRAQDPAPGLPSTMEIDALGWCSASDRGFPGPATDLFLYIF